MDTPHSCKQEPNRCCLIGKPVNCIIVYPDIYVFVHCCCLLWCFCCNTIKWLTYPLRVSRKYIMDTRYGGLNCVCVCVCVHVSVCLWEWGWARGTHYHKHADTIVWPLTHQLPGPLLVGSIHQRRPSGLTEHLKNLLFWDSGLPNLCRSVGGGEQGRSSMEFGDLAVVIYKYVN